MEGSGAFLSELQKIVNKTVQQWGATIISAIVALLQLVQNETKFL